MPNRSHNRIRICTTQSSIYVKLSNKMGLIHPFHSFTFIRDNGAAFVLDACDKGYAFCQTALRHKENIIAGSWEIGNGLWMVCIEEWGRLHMFSEVHRTSPSFIRERVCFRELRRGTNLVQIWRRRLHLGICQETRAPYVYPWMSVTSHIYTGMYFTQ